MTTRHRSARAPRYASRHFRSALRASAALVSPAACSIGVLLALASPRLAFAADPSPGGLTATSGYKAPGFTLDFTNANAPKITATTPGTVGTILWNSFNVGAPQTVTFSNLGGYTINKVVGGNPSSILGTITGDGNVIIINPNGINLGGVNAAAHITGLKSFIASTVPLTGDKTNYSDVSDASGNPSGTPTDDTALVFKDPTKPLGTAGNLNLGFTLPGSVAAGQIINVKALDTTGMQSKSLVAMLGPQVNIVGGVSGALQGTYIAATGKAFQFVGDGLINFDITKFTLTGPLTGSDTVNVGTSSTANSGTINVAGDRDTDPTTIGSIGAQGGTVLLASAVADGLAAAAININLSSQKSIDVSSADPKVASGKIIIRAVDGTVSANPQGSIFVRQSSQLNAGASGGPAAGGSITISGGTVDIGTAVQGFVGGTVITAGGGGGVVNIFAQGAPVTNNGGNLTVNNTRIDVYDGNGTVLLGGDYAAWSATKPPPALSKTVNIGSSAVLRLGVGALTLASGTTSNNRLLVTSTTQTNFAGGIQTYTSSSSSANTATLSSGGQLLMGYDNTGRYVGFQGLGGGDFILSAPKFDISSTVGAQTNSWIKIGDLNTVVSNGLVGTGTNIVAGSSISVSMNSLTVQATTGGITVTPGVNDNIVNGLLLTSASGNSKPTGSDTALVLKAGGDIALNATPVDFSFGSGSLTFDAGGQITSTGPVKFNSLLKILASGTFSFGTVQGAQGGEVDLLVNTADSVTAFINTSLSQPASGTYNALSVGGRGGTYITSSTTSVPAGQLVVTDASPFIVAGTTVAKNVYVGSGSTVTTVQDASNFGTYNLQISGSSIALGGTNKFGTLTLASASTVMQTSGGLTTPSLTVNAHGAVILNGSTNAISAVSITTNNAANTPNQPLVQLTDGSPLKIVGTQWDPTNTASVAGIDAGSGDVTLTTSAPSEGAGGAVAITQINGGIIKGNNLIVNGGGGSGAQLDLNNAISTGSFNSLANVAFTNGAGFSVNAANVSTTATFVASSGDLTVNGNVSAKTLGLRSTNGNVTETTKGVVTATGQLAVLAAQNISLGSTTNAIGAVGAVTTGAKSSITIASQGALNLSAASASYDPSVSITATGVNGYIATLTGASIGQASGANFVAQATTLTATGGDINLSNGGNTFGTIAGPTVAGATTAGLTANNGAITLVASGNTLVQGDVGSATAGPKSLSITSTSAGVTVNGNVYARGAISFTAGQKVVLAPATAGAAPTTITANGGGITIKGTTGIDTSAANLSATGQAVTFTGATIATGQVTGGDITIGDSTATSVRITKDLNGTGNVTVNGPTTIQLDAASGANVTGILTNKKTETPAPEDYRQISGAVIVFNGAVTFADAATSPTKGIALSLASGKVWFSGGITANVPLTLNLGTASTTAYDVRLGSSSSVSANLPFLGLSYAGSAIGTLQYFGLLAGQNKPFRNTAQTPIRVLTANFKVPFTFNLAGLDSATLGGLGQVLLPAPRSETLVENIPDLIVDETTAQGANTGAGAAGGSRLKDTPDSNDDKKKKPPK